MSLVVSWKKKIKETFSNLKKKKGTKLLIKHSLKRLKRVFENHYAKFGKMNGNEDFPTQISTILAQG
jgi:hypothetical protein